MLGKVVRASIQAVTRVIKSAGVPEQITQEPFDYDPSHYRRLCSLNGAEPECIDLCDYAMDLRFMEIQPDLLRYLLPVLLKAWKRNLFEGSVVKYRGFVDLFWGSLVVGSALEKVLSEAERGALGIYFGNSILDRLDIEESLRFSGMYAGPYYWVAEWVSYGTVFSDIEILWSEWWEMRTSGHAVAAFQYASVLMYEDNKNPVFDPWTKDKGGGPPALWSTTGMLSGVGWRPENLAFLKATLSADYLEQRLRMALTKIENLAARKVASRIMDDFEGQRSRLELRIEELPELLSDASRVDGFTI